MKNNIGAVTILSSYGCSLAAVSLVFLASCVRPSYPAEACLNLAFMTAATLMSFSVALFPFRAEVVGGRTAKIAAKLRLDTVKVSIPASLVLEAALTYGALKAAVPAGLPDAELLTLRITGTAASICGLIVGIMAVIGAWSCATDKEGE